MANLQRISNLMMLPDHTGGRAVFSNEPSESLPAIFREAIPTTSWAFTRRMPTDGFTTSRSKSAARGDSAGASRLLRGGAKTRRLAAPRGVRPRFMTPLPVCGRRPVWADAHHGVGRHAGPAHRGSGPDAGCGSARPRSSGPEKTGPSTS
jgi:hypothetical protein